MGSKTTVTWTVVVKNCDFQRFWSLYLPNNGHNFQVIIIW